MFKGLCFDALALFEGLLSSPEVDILRGQVGQALMIARVIIVLDEETNLSLEIVG